MSRSFLLVLFLCCGSFPFARALRADDAKNVRPNAVRTKETAASLSPERERGALEFVERHHPELTALLTELKTHKEKQYERAVRELASARERIEQLQTTDAALHDLELAAWKVKSRIQLLTAKLSMNDQTASKEELKRALEEQYDLRGKIARHERGRLAERMKKIDKELAEAEARREAAIQKQFDSLTSSSAGEKRTKESESRKKLP